MALDQIKDAFTNLDTPYERGMATGLCSAFYMCGLLNEGEWKALMELIPKASGEARNAKVHGIENSEEEIYSRVLN